MQTSAKSDSAMGLVVQPPVAPAELLAFKRRAWFVIGLWLVFFLAVMKWGDSHRVTLEMIGVVIVGPAAFLTARAMWLLWKASHESERSFRKIKRSS